MAQLEAVTRDTLLGGQVTLRQHAAGYRVAMDPVLLSASVPASAGEAVLDVGAQKARSTARATMDRVRAATGL